MSRRNTGFALAPDTNIGATSDENIIYIDIGGPIGKEIGVQSER